MYISCLNGKKKESCFYESERNTAICYRYDVIFFLYFKQVIVWICQTSVDLTGKNHWREKQDAMTIREETIEIQYSWLTTEPARLENLSISSHDFLPSGKSTMHF